jgi:predicted aldo/keto reductase-like oxidoreductase
MKFMKPKKSTRRSFLKNSSIGILATGLAGISPVINRSEADQPPDLPKIKEYRRLGRTGAMVSDIGSGVPYSEGVLKAVLDAGVNFIETAESYSNGRNEILIGNVMKNFEREKIFIATKASPGYKIFNSADDIIRRAEESLKRLQTGYIDLYMIHQAQNRIAVKNEYFHEACDILKKYGKIRYVGLSCHGHSWWEEPGESFEDILMTAIEDGRFDVLFCPYNFFDPEMGERILKACKQHDIGTMIMKANPMVSFDDYEKTLKRGEELGYTERKDWDKLKSWMENSRRFFEKYNMTDIEQLKDGAIQFILTNKNVSTICCRFRNFSDVEKYVKLSGTTLNDRTSKLLASLKNDLGFMHCRIGCNSCEQACPHKIPVNTILRYNYYFCSQNMEKEAMQYYHELKSSRADICMKCKGYCEQVCPYGVVTRTLLTVAHENLSLGNCTYV